MADVSRAVLLPSVEAPSAGALKNLALYWDEVWLPEYRDRITPASDADHRRPELDDAHCEFVDAGVVRVIEREVPVADPTDEERSAARAWGIEAPLPPEAGAVRLMA